MRLCIALGAALCHTCYCLYWMALWPGHNARGHYVWGIMPGSIMSGYLERQPMKLVMIWYTVGRVMTSETGLKTLLSLRNALILNVKQPTGGRWLIELTAEGAHTVRVTGLSSLDFVHGFSVKPTLALSHTDPQPTTGKLTFSNYNNNNEYYICNPQFKQSSNVPWYL